MKKFINWIAKKRLLDGYLGIMGIILFYKVMALYFGNIHILCLTLSFWHWEAFSIDLVHNTDNRKNSDTWPMPVFSFSLKLFNIMLIDNTKEPYRIINERSKQHIAEYHAQQAEERRLVDAARAAGL